LKIRSLLGASCGLIGRERRKPTLSSGVGAILIKNLVG
jgi:hypothetical protein